MDLRNRPDLHQGVRGLRNNNPGNLVKSSNAWQGKTEGTDTRFETFVDTVYGLRAMYKDLYNDWSNKGRDTIAKLLAEYAPATENNTSNYVRIVSNRTGLGSAQKLSLNDLYKVGKAIAFVENGAPVSVIPESEYRQAWQMATNTAAPGKSSNGIIPALAVIGYLIS